MKIDFEKIWRQMRAHYALGEHSLHGPDHWRMVERNGRRLCRLNGADETVVRLFAVFHDVERRLEGHDPNHGVRAAELVRSLHGDLFELEQPRFDQLLQAISQHNDGEVTEELTIGSCWDADRMDLPRVGIVPNPRKMSTFHGRAYAELGETRWIATFADSPRFGDSAN